MVRSGKFFLCLCMVLFARLVGHADKPELTVQTGHTNAINSIAFSPDGRLLASGGHDSTVKLWDVKTGIQLRTLTGHSYTVTSVAFSPDGKMLVSGSLDATVRRWDVNTGNSIQPLKQSGSVNSVAFSPDGKIIAVGTWDNAVTLWDVSTGSRSLTLRGHQGRVNTVAFSPDGRLLASGGDDYSIKVWEVSSGRERRTLTLTRPSDRPQLFTDVNTGKPLPPHPAAAFDSVNSVCFSPDGKRLASVSFSVKKFDLNGIDFTVKLWDVDRGKEVRTFETFAGGGQASQFIFETAEDQNALAGSVSFSADGTALIARAADYDVKMWDVATGRTLNKFPILTSDDDPAGTQRYIKEIEKRTWRFNPHLPTLSPDGKYFAIVVENNVMLWDIAAGVSVEIFAPHASSVQAVAFDPRGKVLASVTDTSPTRLWDLGTGKVLRTLNRRDYPPGASAVAFSPKKELLVTASNGAFGSTATIDTWDTNTGERLRAFKGAKAGALSIALRPDGKILAAGRSGDAIALWDVDAGQKIRDLAKATSDQNYFAWSPDGRILAHATGGVTSSTHTDPPALDETEIKKLMHVDRSNYIRLWDVGTGRELWRVGDNRQSFHSVAFSPDGQILAGGDSDSTVHLWDVPSGQKLREVKGNYGTFYSVTFSPDGKTLAGGGADHTIYLWDVRTGEELGILKGHAGAVLSVAFNAGGRRLASGSADGTIKLWDAGEKKEVCTFVPIDEANFLTATPDNYYTTSKAGFEGVAFRLGNEGFPFEQFDLRLNRPDVVLQRLGNQDPKLVNAYRAAYLKRLEKMHFTEAALDGDFHLPELEVTTPNLPLNTGSREQRFSIKASDSKYALNRVNVWVNDVPANGLINGKSFSGSQGYGLAKERARAFEGGITLSLSAGPNKVQVSVLNEKGVESLKRTFKVTYTPPTPAPKPDLYVIAIGVARYRQSRFNLAFAAKDAADLTSLLRGTNKERFDRVRVLLLTDESATRDGIRQRTAELLKETKVDDEVIIFFAGHGVLDEKLDYYFGTHDIDFAHPARKGLSFNAMEEMLDGIEARKKLLLIDTCHAGEVDKVTTVASTGQEGRGPGGRAEVVGAGPGKSYVGLGNSFLLMQELFADLRRGSGAEVIAAAGGVQYAYEEHGNGFFTHALLEGLRGSKADQNEDGKVFVSELRDWVLWRVQQLTGGRQTPTARRENAALDWSIN